MKEARLYVRVDEKELASFKKAAEKVGKTVSEYVRELLNSQETKDTVILDAAYGKPKKLPRSRKVRKDAGRESVSRASMVQDSECQHGIKVGKWCGYCQKIISVEDL